jgi:hypothetical protein
MPPLVSIVTPSYNQAAFLEKTLQSILVQDYPALELLVADGGSGDGSQEIIRSTARRDQRLVWWVSEPDRGQAEAINKGLAQAQGEFVAWLNSDDLYLPGAIRQAVELLQSEPAASFVFGDALSIDVAGRPFNRLRFSHLRSDRPVLEELTRFRILCQPSVFMRRSAVIEAQLEPGVYLDPSYHYMLDHQLWIRLARCGDGRYAGSSAAGAVRPWSAARQHPGAKNVALAGGFADETQRLLNWMQNQPDLAGLIEQNRKKTLAGAYRLQGRYLLDGAQPRQALGAYLRALRLWPSFTLQHSKRIAYALGSAGLELLRLQRRTQQQSGLQAALTTRQRRRQADRLQAELASDFPELKDWPGIELL